MLQTAIGALLDTIVPELLLHPQHALVVAKPVIQIPQMQKLQSHILCFDHWHAWANTGQKGLRT